MALVLKDRVYETSTTSGTGTLTLAGAVDNFQTFSSAIGNGNTTYYTIADDSAKQWEVGIGTVGAGTLSRNTVYASSNGGSLVNFSANAKQVFCDYPASKSVYTDASGNISNLAGSISKPTFIEFDQTYATALSAGQLGWDGNNTLALGMAGGNVVQHIGEDSFFYIKASSAITKGQLVMFTGAVGASGVLTGAPSTGVTIGSYIMGVAAEDIANNGFGLIQCFGELTGVNTSGFNEGDILYYNSAVTGGLTSTFPTSGPIVIVAAVAKKSAGGGVIYIRVSVTQRITAGTGIFVSQSATGTTITNTSPSSGGTVTSVGGTGTVSGISLSGTVTSSGNLTLGGALDLSSPPAIGGTTPAAGTFTTITGQTEVLKGTGQNLFTYSQQIGGTNWVNNNTTSTLNNTTAPDSTNTATSLIESATTAQHFVSQAATFSANITISVSVYVKFPLTTRAFGLQATDAPNGGSSYAEVDVSYLGVAQTPSVSGTFSSITASSTSVGNGWYRVQMSFKTSTVSTITVRCFLLTNAYVQSYLGDGTSNIYVWGAQLELGTTANTYIPTTTTAVYGTPSLSFSGVAGLGLQSDGSLYVSPAGTGAIQAQATTSSATGGNARGANAVDWQTSRGSAGNVASASYSVLVGGTNNTASATQSVLVGGGYNSNGGNYSFLGGGGSNTISSAAGGNTYGVLLGGLSNTAGGAFNFIGGGYTNSGTSASAVTTQSGTMNGTTAVTLSGSNASIKVGQLITGTSIANNTYVAAISGTSLTLSQNASGSSTSTLSFYTPHGVVVGGGNNQATGSYSFIGGGGDAGTAANRNVASGDWSVVCGGIKNVASGGYSAVVGGYINTANNFGTFVGGGGYLAGGSYPNTASGQSASVVGGMSNTASGNASSVIGGYSGSASGTYSAVLGGSFGTTRGIAGMLAFSACQNPISQATGLNQGGMLVLARQTTDATATVLTSDTNAAGTTNQVILPNNSAYFVRGTVIAGVTGGGNTSAWDFKGAIKRGANAASTALVGVGISSNLVAQDAGAATWAVSITADTTNGGLKVTVTGQAATTIRWVCEVETTEMTY